jgi:type VII secretion integral membrane protein EccD
MTDLVLPAATPIETYIDETVNVLADLLDGTPAEVLAGFDFKAQGVWAFARPGSPPLKATESLDEAGVVDGALLTLVSVSRTERYRPLVEDVIDAMAVLEESPEFDRKALNHLVGLAIPVAALAITWASLWTWSKAGHGWWWLLVLGVLGLLVFGASFVAKNRYDNVDLSESLLVAALPLLGGAAALAVPLPRGISGLGAPQLAGAAAVVLAVVLATRGGPRQRAAAASSTAVIAVAVTAGAVAYGYGGASWVPAGAIAFGLIVLTNSAKLTVAVARIALPPIPAPGEVIANEELLDPVAAHSNITDEESATWRAIIESVPDSAARLTERSTLARQLLIGFLGGGVLVLTAGSIAVLEHGHFFVHTLIVAGLVTVVCGFRSRLYAERWCGWALLAATVAIPTGVMIRLCLWDPNGAWLVIALYVVLASVALVVVGATDGVRRVSPVTKRILELTDGAAIAAVIPMLLWIAGVYDQIRNIRF